MHILKLEWSAPYGHFSHPEMGTEGVMTFRLPPRTAILGLLAALLGLEKDIGVVTLQQSEILVSVQPTTILPSTFWHTETQLQYNIKEREKMPIMWPNAFKNNAPAIKLIRREWLIHPRFIIWIGESASSKDLFDSLVHRIQAQRFAYPPCMGSAMMTAKVSWIAQFNAEPVQTDENTPCSIHTPWNLNHGKIDADALRKSEFTIDYFPRTVNEHRRFTIEPYCYRHQTPETITVFPKPNIPSPIWHTEQGDNIAWL